MDILLLEMLIVPNYNYLPAWNQVTKYSSQQLLLGYLDLAKLGSSTMKNARPS
jgi:hypothetical protein